MEKGKGFYVTTDDPFYDTLIQIEKNGYDTYCIPFSDADETIILTPNGDLDDYIVIKCRLTGVRNKIVKYGVLNRSAANVVLEAEGGKANFIKMAFSEKSSLIGREITFEGINGVYKIIRYDFEKNGYVTMPAFDELPSTGSFAYILNNAETNNFGEFSIFIHKNYFEKYKTVSILLASGMQQYKKTVSKGNYTEPLIFDEK